MRISDCSSDVCSSDLGAWAADLMASGRPVVEAALELARRIKGEFAYVSGATDAATPVAEAFAARHGVCQDFAHVMVAALRWFGLPAAYVRGYLRTDPQPRSEERRFGTACLRTCSSRWSRDH